MIYRTDYLVGIRDQFTALKDCFTMIQAKDQYVDLMFDLRLAVPSSALELSFYRSLLLTCPKNVNSMIYITSASFAKQLRLTWRLIRAHDLFNLHIVNTVDEAYTLLEVVRQAKTG